MEARVQSSNLNEQLGMVQYIFSDKTGTLTQNIMEFKRFSAGEVSYGSDNPKEIEYAPGVTNVNFYDPQFDEHLCNAEHPNHYKLKEFVEALGVCHTVITEPKVAKNGKPYVAYNASSPDELALVNGARHLGFGFRERDEDGNMVIDSWDGVRKYKLLNLIEFDSTRKRMSVIVRTPEDKLMLICKGADSIIEKRLTPGQPLLEKTQRYLEEYAKQGLRTLLVASKELDNDFYSEWDKQYKEAAVSVNREREINRVAELIENDFELIGSTAIEDKLQVDVGKTIHDLKRAGIKVWVLTGDKVETAINIGYSCRLLNNEMNTFILE